MGVGGGVVRFPESESLLCSTQSCPILCDLMDFSLSGSSAHGISQARILEWVATSSSRGSSLPRDQIHVSCIGRQIPSLLMCVYIYIVYHICYIVY